MARLPYQVSILAKHWLTHNVVRFVIEKPENFQFNHGQAIELTIDEPHFYHDAAPFTITNLNDDANIELIVKVYPHHKGMTDALSRQKEGDKLYISAPWDSFPYFGPGVFIAGGSGITAFLSIIRSLAEKTALDDHQLIWANRKHQDIFIYKELYEIFESRLKIILSKTRSLDHTFGHINKPFLKQMIMDFNQYFYVCGPGTFPDEVKSHLIHLGAEPNNVRIAY